MSGYALVLLSVSNVSQGMGFSIHTLASRSEKAVASELRDGPASIPETSPCSTDTVRLHASMPMNTFEDGRLPDGESFLVGAASGPLSPDCCNKPLTPSVDRLDWDWQRQDWYSTLLSDQVEVGDDGLHYRYVGSLNDWLDYDVIGFAVIQ